MLKERAREITILVAVADAALLAAAFSLACLLRFLFVEPVLGQAAQPSLRPYIWILYVSIPMLLYLFGQAGLYDSLRRRSPAEILWLTTKPFLIATALMGLAIFLFQDKAYSRSVFFGYFLLGCLFISAQKQATKYLAHRARRQGYNSRNVLIVGANDDAAAIGRLLYESRHFGYHVEGHLVGHDDQVALPAPPKVLGHVRDLEKILAVRAIDEVIFAVPYAHVPLYDRLIRYCDEMGVKIHLKIDRMSSLLSRAYPSQLGEFPLLTLSSTPHDAMDVLAKRLLDILVSVAALVLASPVMGITALAIRLTSRGPVIYRQVRNGLNGRRFVLYKFRSMFSGAEKHLERLRGRNEMSGPVFKMTRDPRITPVGRFIRRWSIDELPQLFNVLKGDMSLVGPRPPIPDEVGSYEHWQKRRLSMKPGLTCLWQVKGRNQIDFNEWMKLDMDYIDNWSLRLDLKILARTIPAVFFARGAR